MKLKLYCLIATLALSLFCLESKAQTISLTEIPDSVYVGDQIMHVQGFALDRARQCMYFSFTSQFYKTDLQGNIIASIDRVQGHLGAMTLSPLDGRVYASLECKDDEIGAGIASQLKVENLDRASVVFYIAIIDVDKLTRLHMDPEKDDVMTTVCIKEPMADYQAKVMHKGQELEHRYACSGIDGVCFAPSFGTDDGKMYLYIAYGIYGDKKRDDNNHNVLLRYDVSQWKEYETKVVFGQVHMNGPEQPQKKYFVHTGNTNWGVQNMAYDSYTDRLYMFVYKGKKETYPNYDLFAVNMSARPYKAKLAGVDYEKEKQLHLNLAQDGLYDPATKTYGWRFPYGSTGVCALGEGYWLISEPHKDKATKLNSCNARLYRWTGSGECPFLKITR